MNTVNKVLDIASSQVGYLEKSKTAYLADKSVLYKFTEGAGSDNYTKYNKEMHDIYPAVMDFPSPWCDCFVDWCFYQAYGVANAKGLLGGNFNDYTVASAALYKNKGVYFKTPKIGDQIFFNNGQRICHTGLVYNVDTKRVYTIEGNTGAGNTLIANGGGVAKKSYLLTYERIDGYGRPKYDTEELKKAKYTAGTWSKDETGWWYAKTDDTFAQSEWVLIKNHWYYFDRDGYAVKGLQTIDGKIYYFETAGDLECALLHTDDKGALVEWYVV